MELIDNIKLRSKLSRRWRLARKQNKPEEILKIYKEEYEEQKKRTSIMAGKKKGEWEIYKIEETKIGLNASNIRPCVIKTEGNGERFTLSRCTYVEKFDDGICL